MKLVRFYLSNRPAGERRDFNTDEAKKSRFNFSHKLKVTENRLRPVYIQASAPLTVEQSPWYENETIIAVQGLGTFYVYGKPVDIADALNEAMF